MEPASLTHSRTGSLENPGVLENVPGHVIPILTREFDDFDTESTSFHESGRTEGEDFNQFVERVGTQDFEAKVKDLTMPVEFGLENLNFFIDWSKNAPFEVQRGEGECAV
jgi:hypothetical protein